MNKRELMSAWKKLDKALEAIEKLTDAGLNKDENLFGDVAFLKNEIEPLLDEKTKKGGAFDV